MTSFSHPNQPRPHRACRRRAFTLIELLVVIGILLVLISLLLPALNRAHRNAVRASMMGDFAVIVQGLDAYRNDFGDYPRTGVGTSASGATGQSIYGAIALCWALVAPGPTSQDGYGLTTGTDTGAPGFRLLPTSQGRVYGPYIPVDRFRMGTWKSGSNVVNTVAAGTTWDDTNTVLADRYGNVILYFAGVPSISPSKSFVSVYSISSPSPQSVYNFNENLQYLPTPSSTVTTPNPINELTQRMFEYRLGNTSMSGIVAAGETPVVAPYLLWSAGPDGIYGPQVTANSNNTYVTTGQDDDIVYPDELQTVPPGMTP